MPRKKGKTMLPNPTPQLVRRYIKNFDRENQEIECTLAELFALFPKNTENSQVVVKASAINILFQTWISGITTVANHITNLDIDSAIERGDAEIVDRIARVKFKEKIRRNYSFATKYCFWHRPNSYPMYDWRVDYCLWEYRVQDPARSFQFKRTDLRNYDEFRKIVDNFKVCYGLTDFTYREIDKFLYHLGGEFGGDSA